MRSSLGRKESLEQTRSMWHLRVLASSPPDESDISGSPCSPTKSPPHRPDERRVAQLAAGFLFSVSDRIVRIDTVIDRSQFLPRPQHDDGESRARRNANARSCLHHPCARLRFFRIRSYQGSRTDRTHPDYSSTAERRRVIFGKKYHFI